MLFLRTETRAKSGVNVSSATSASLKSSDLYSGNDQLGAFGKDFDTEKKQEDLLQNQMEDYVQKQMEKEFESQKRVRAPTAAKKATS